MAKKSKEELLEKQKTLKEEHKAAKEERRAFEKENKLAKDEDHAGDEKHGKKWKKLNDAVTAKKEALDKVATQLEELKAESASSRTTYDYPKDIADDPAAKKKYRAKMRAEAKKAAKGESSEGKEKKEKKAEKKEKKEKKEKAEAED